MKELSIFIDESGDFGEYDYRSPYYIISMVLHDQAVDITDEIRKLEDSLSYMELSKHCIHTGPIIRQEEEYRYMTPETRTRILKRLMAFVRSIDIKCDSFYIEKKHISDTVDAAGKLSKQISRYIKDNYDYFMSYEIVKIYYDNGQVEVNKILSAVFHILLDHVEFRKVLPADYRLFQVADMVCTLKLIELKMKKHALSKSERNFFGDERIIKKNYLKPIAEKKMQKKL